MILSFTVRLQIPEGELADTPTTRAAAREWLLAALRRAAGPDVVVDVNGAGQKEEGRRQNPPLNLELGTWNPSPPTP